MAIKISGVNIVDDSQNLRITGVSSFTGGPVIIGSAVSTGVPLQVLQVTGNLRFNGNIGIGSTTSEQPGDNITFYGDNPQIGLYERDATANNRRWILASGNKELYIQAVDDSYPGTGGGNIIAIGRSDKELSYIQAKSTTTGQVFFNFDFFNASIGIGTTTPSERLHVIGNILASGNVTGYSDQSLKNNIQTIPNALDKVLQLRGVEYDRKDIEGNPHNIGVIAQEVEKIIPEVVTTHNDGVKSVAYGNIVGLLIEAIKEQQEQINILKEELDRLK